MYTVDAVYAEELENAVASVEMEGYSVTQSQKELCLEFVSGRINKDEFIKIMLERC